MANFFISKSRKTDRVNCVVNYTTYVWSRTLWTCCNSFIDTSVYIYSLEILKLCIICVTLMQIIHISKQGNELIGYTED